MTDTKVVSARLPEHEVEALSEEADALGFDSTNQYIRYLLKHRDEPDPSHPIERYEQRLSDLEDRVETLEARHDDTDGDG